MDLNIFVFHSGTSNHEVFVSGTFFLQTTLHVFYHTLYCPNPKVQPQYSGFVNKHKNGAAG